MKKKHKKIIYGILTSIIALVLIVLDETGYIDLEKYLDSDNKVITESNAYTDVNKLNEYKVVRVVDGDTFEEINIDKKSNVFRLLSRIDEEVHRFTINYHKEIRSKGSISSVLDNINGLGEVRKKKLIKKYGSVTKIKEASIEELKEIIPENVAIELHEFLKSK